VDPAPRVATQSVTVVEVAPRYTLNPSSLLEASAQVRLMAELDAAVATRFEGAAGGLVIALATLDAGDSPAELYAVTL